QLIDFRWSEVARINLDVLLPIEVQGLEAHLEELLNRVHLTGGDYKILRLVLLKHQPHSFDEVACKAPVAFCFQIAQEELVLQADTNSRCGASNLARNEGFTAPRRLVIEENTVAGIHPVGLSVVENRVVREELGNR